jgi:hypothetical protein
LELFYFERSSLDFRIGKAHNFVGEIKSLGVLRLRVPKSWDASLRMTIPWRGKYVIRCCFDLPEVI